MVLSEIFTATGSCINNNQVKTLKKQCENMRSILMNKDEEIMKLKNDLPIKPKDGGTDRLERAFPSQGFD